MEEKIINTESIRENVVEVVREVPRDVPVEKIVYNQVEVPKIVEVDRQVVVPIEIPVPVDRVVEKLVPMTETIEKVVQVPTVVEKVVVQNTIEPQPVEVPRIEEKIVVDTRIKEVVKEIPYIREQVKEVEVVKEKIVPVQNTVQEIVTAKQIVEKVVEKSTVVPKIYEVERLEEKVVEVPKIVEVEKIVPQLVNVNRYIQNIVEKIVEVPVIMERVKEVVKENEKIVEVRNEYENVREVEKVVEKAVVLEKFKEAVRDINHIEKVLQVVDRVVNVPVEVMAHEEKLVEVPYILEKIVEKVVVMPQIVEVLKYVHEVIEEETLGVAVGAEVSIHEQKYKTLGRDVKGQLDILLVELRKLKTSTPALRVQIELIEGFLAQLEQFLLYPRIFQVPKEVEKIVEVQKDKVVAVPKQDERSLKMELSLSLLVEKLIMEIKRIKKSHPNVNLDLEEDVRLIFFSELDDGRALEGEMAAKLKSFSDGVNRKFESLGSWSADHQLMLNSFLQERFLMANLVKSANQEIEKSKSLQIHNAEVLKRYESDLDNYKNSMVKIRSSLGGNLGTELDSMLVNIFTDLETSSSRRIEATTLAGDLQIADLRIQSLIREKDAELSRLRGELVNLRKVQITTGTNEAQTRTIQILQDENTKLKNEINELRVDRGSSELVSSYKAQVQELNNRILELEQEKSNLSAELINLRHEMEVKIQVQNFNSYVDVKHSDVTHYAGGSGTKQSMTSPVGKIGGSSLSSPKEEDIKIPLVDSKYEASSSAVKPGDNRRTIADESSRSTYGVQQVTSTYQTPASSVSSSSGVYGGASMTASGAGSKYPQGTSRGSEASSVSGPTYQAGTTSSGIYQSGTGSGVYQGAGSGVGSTTYQGATSSGVYQSGTGSGSGSGVYQSGTYQPGSYQAGSYQSSTYQSSSYRPAQGTTQPGQPSTQPSTQPGATQGSSYQYRYERK